MRGTYLRYVPASLRVHIGASALSRARVGDDRSDPMGGVRLLQRLSPQIAVTRMCCHLSAHPEVCHLASVVVSGSARVASFDTRND